MSNIHPILGEKARLFKRPGSPYWHCACYIENGDFRTSTKTASLKEAIAFAEEWYLNLKVKQRVGELKGGKKFKAAAEKFETEYAALVGDERNPRYVASHSLRLKVHLLPFFGNKPLTDITPGLVREYLVHRMTSRKRTIKNEKGEEIEEVMRPSRSTVHHELVTLRHVLKTAVDHGWLKFVPDLQQPYKASGKISHRAWFSHTEYAELLKRVKERSTEPPHPSWVWEYQQMHDYVVFMVNTGLRPDEASRLEFRDVEIVKDRSTNETILEISVRGKRGVGFCKSMPAAVFAFERIRDRLRPARLAPEAWKIEQREAAKTVKAQHPESTGESAEAKAERPKKYPVSPTDKLFPNSHRDMFNAVLEGKDEDQEKGKKKEENLKKDREGRVRTAYSLRHTYICFRLMEGADIYQIAKNCRTSVEMIEKFYAAHIKDQIDAAAVNVKRPPPQRDANDQERDSGSKSRKAGAKKGKPNELPT